MRGMVSRKVAFRQDHGTYRPFRGRRPPVPAHVVRHGRPPLRQAACHSAGTAGGSQPGRDVCGWRQTYARAAYVTQSPAR